LNRNDRGRRLSPGRTRQQATAAVVQKTASEEKESELQEKESKLQGKS